VALFCRLVSRRGTAPPSDVEVADPGNVHLGMAPARDVLGATANKFFLPSFMATGEWRVAVLVLCQHMGA
jgi:hypothetical protein